MQLRLRFMALFPSLYQTGNIPLVAPGRFGSVRLRQDLSGPLKWLNAILSLLQPLDRYRTPSAIGSAIGRPLSRPISHPNTVVGVLNRPVLNRLGGSTASDSGAIVSKTPLKQARSKNAIEAAILNRVLDRH